LTTLIAACHGPGPAPAPASPPPVPAPAGPDLSDPLALLPADSDVIVRIDVAAMRRSPLWAKYKDHVIAAIAPSFADCGYDPFSDITTITAGLPMSNELGNFVIRGLDRDKTLHCLHTSKVETDTSVTFDGDILTLTNKSGSVNMLTFVDAHNAVMQGSTKPTKETLNQALKLGAPLRADADLQAVEKKLASNAALSFVSRPGSSAFPRLMQQRIGAPARYLYATLHLSDRVEAHAAIVLANPDDATAIAAQMQPKIAALKGYVDQFEERADGDTLLVDVAITEAQVKGLVEMVQTVIGN
jgi:hypothetical protein